MVIFLSSILYGNSNYDIFLKEQINYVNLINKDTQSPQTIQQLLKTHKLKYAEKINEIITDKHTYFRNIPQYDSKIYALKKMININKRVGSKYAILRDEVKIKSYLLLTYQNKMLENIFNIQDNISKVEFSEILNQFVSKNQMLTQKLLTTDYSSILKIDLNSRILIQAQNNIKELNALVEINRDTINYIYIFEDKIFKLKKYANYHLAGIVLALNKIDIVKKVDNILQNYHLNTVKLFFIIITILLIYIIQWIVYRIMEYYLLTIVQLQEYIKYILLASKKIFGLIIKVININIIIYIFNDFNNPQNIIIFFNIAYIFIITLFVFRLVNIFLSVYIKRVDKQKKHIKHEIVNIGAKVLNSIVVLIGILIALYIAGIDLTAVLSGLGIGGLAVALASKDSLANFFGTLSVLFSDVFSQGDWIEVDSKEGVVVEIGLRITTIRTFDNALISIPNAIFANNQVKNWNKRILGRRIKMKIGIKYDSKIEDIQNTVNEIRDMLDKHPKIATKNTQHIQQNNKTKKKLISQDDYRGVKKTLLVYLDEFADSSINILIYCFTKTTNWQEWLEIKEDVMYKIMYIAKKNNIEFAFNSLSLYHENNNTLGDTK